MGDDSVFVEVEMPPEELYVCEYGDETVEKSHIDRLEEVSTNYCDLDDMYDSRPLMFITPDRVEPEYIRTVKW